MGVSNKDIRLILKFYFDKGENATQACHKICEVYGHDTINIRTAQNWFAKFRCGYFDVEDAPRSGRPCTEKIDEILKKVEEDRHISSHDIAKDLGISYQTVLSHLKKAGYKKILGKWEPQNSIQEIPAKMSCSSKKRTQSSTKTANKILKFSSYNKKTDTACD